MGPLHYLVSVTLCGFVSGALDMDWHLKSNNKSINLIKVSN